MMHDARVSVVIPSFNRAECLPRSIESALGQTRTPAEVIVVDDGSTDDSAAVAARFGSAVRYLAQPRRGVAAARNTGVHAAVGDWIAFLDADDVWLPTKLEVQLALAAAQPRLVWCTTNHITTDQAGHPLGGTQGYVRDLPGFAMASRGPERLLAQDLDPVEITVAGEGHLAFVGDCFRLFCMGNLVLPSGAIVRRAEFLTAGGFNEGLRVASDTEFFHRLSAGALGGFVMTPLLLWRRGRTDTIVSTRNVIPLIETALASLRSGAQLRVPMGPDVRRTAQRTERRLLRRLAYAHLTALDRAGVRNVVLRSEGTGVSRDPVLWLLLGLSLAPTHLLALGRAAKQALRR